MRKEREFCRDPETIELQQFLFFPASHTTLGSVFQVSLNSFSPKYIRFCAGAKRPNPHFS